MNRMQRYESWIHETDYDNINQLIQTNKKAWVTNRVMREKGTLTNQEKLTQYYETVYDSEIVYTDCLHEYSMQQPFREIWSCSN
jgi:hypothetical protein